MLHCYLFRASTTSLSFWKNEKLFGEISAYHDAIVTSRLVVIRHVLHLHHFAFSNLSRLSVYYLNIVQGVMAHLLTPENPPRNLTVEWL